MICTQPELKPASTRLISLKVSSPFSCSQRSPGYRVEGHPEAITQAVREDFLDVRSGLAASAHRRRRTGCLSECCRRRSDEGSRRSSARRRVPDRRTGHRAHRGRRPVHEILQLAAAAVVAKLDVQLAVRTEPDDAAVVIAARLAVRQIVLKRAKLDQVSIERQRRSVPDETVDAVSKQRHGENIVGVRTCLRRVRAFRDSRNKRIGGWRRRAGPEEIHKMSGCKIRVQGNSQESAFRCVVDGEIEGRSCHRSVDDVLDLTSRLLEHQKLIGTQKCDRYRLIEGSTAARTSRFGSTRTARPGRPIGCRSRDPK